MLIANKSFPYGGRRLQADEEFAAKGSGDERTLLAVKLARRAEPARADTKPRKARKNTYQTRDMVAAPVETQPEAAPEAPETIVPAITGEAPGTESLQQSAEPDSDA